MTLSLFQAATVYPVTLDEAKLHVKAEDGTDDPLIAALIASATASAEHTTSRAFLPQKWRVTLDSFPLVIGLQRPPVTGIDSIEYVDKVTRALTTIDPSKYQLINSSNYTASVQAAYGQSWPIALEQPESVRVTFSCGSSGAIPAPVKSWILLRVGVLYANRESVVTEARNILELPFVDSLLDPYKAFF